MVTVRTCTVLHRNLAHEGAEDDARVGQAFGPVARYATGHRYDGLREPHPISLAGNDIR